MGLMICQKLVTMNKGEIELRSEGLGLGATAVFSFKAELPEGENDDNDDKEGSYNDVPDDFTPIKHYQLDEE